MPCTSAKKARTRPARPASSATPRRSTSQALNAQSQAEAARATQAQVLNGLNVRVDPSEQIAGAITAVFPDQQLVVTTTFVKSPALADEIFHSFAHAS